MTREVFILGISHELQCGAAECGVDKISLLEREIRRILSEYGIRRIAEEMSDDGLRERAGDKATGTVCQRIAGNGVPVHFVDLGEKERACLSLSPRDIDVFMFKHSNNNSEMMRVREALSALCDEVRERVWVARVLSGDEWPVLLVCGADHAVSVSALFKYTGKRIGVQATVLTGAPSDIGRIVTKMIHVDAGRRIGQQLSSFRRELPDATSDPL